MKPRSCENAKLVAETLRQRLRLQIDGMTPEKLAALCGMSLRSLNDQIAADVPSFSVRWRIERAFDFKFQLWSSQNELAARARCVRQFGCDPRSLTIGELKKFCQQLGAENARYRTFESWFESLTAWLAAHPDKNSANLGNSKSKKPQNP